MKRFFCVVLVGLGLCAAILSTASAQVGTYNNSNSRRQTQSPFLNLIRGGSATLNYYGLVRPQVDTGQAVQTLQFQQQILKEGTTTLGDGGNQPISPTGHAAQFFSYGNYFAMPQGRPGNLQSTPGFGR